MLIDIVAIEMELAKVVTISCLKLLDYRQKTFTDVQPSTIDISSD